MVKAKKLKPYKLTKLNNRLKKSQFSRLHALIFIVVFACVGAAIILSSKAAGPNLWVSTTGSDTTCVRGDQTKPCASVQKACLLSQGGDVIQIAAGTYTTGFNLTGCNPASNITFTNSGNVFFAARSTISNSSNITLQGDQVGHGVGFSLAITNITGTGAAPSSNINWNKINLYCEPNVPWTVLTSGISGETWCSSALGLTGAVTNFTWNGGDQENWASCLTSCTNSDGQGNPNDNQITSSDPTNIPTNITVKNVIVKHYFSLDNNGSSGDHSEAWVINTGSHLNFTNDSWMACNPPPSTGYAVNNSCNTAYIFFGQAQAAGVPTADYVTFTGNIIAPGPNTNAAVHWDYDYPQANEIHTTWSYNSIDGTFLIKGAGSAPIDPGGVNLTGTNMIFAGNVAPKASYFGCFPSAVYTHNMWFRSDGLAAKCGASDIEKDTTGAASIWADPTNYNYNLLTNSGGIDAGEATYCPNLDLNNVARPQGLACDIGAEEYVLGSSTIPGDINSDGHVTIVDLSILLSHYGTSGNSSQGDCNNDSLINITDLSILLSHYGS